MIEKLKYPNTLVQKHRYHALMSEHSPVRQDSFNSPIRFSQGDKHISCVYDYMGRRYAKKVTSNGTVSLQQRYIYRGYLQIACVDLTRSGHPVLWHITWDPTETRVTRPLAIQKNATWYSYSHDLTKNVTELYQSDGLIATTYDYSPYGAATAEGIDQPLQWSSEYHDAELALTYYNYRHYNPTDGCWINRDLIQEDGGFNLYGFVGNNANCYGDSLGGRYKDYRRAMKPTNGKCGTLNVRLNGNNIEVEDEIWEEPNFWEPWVNPKDTGERRWRPITDDELVSFFDVVDDKLILCEDSGRLLMKAIKQTFDLLKVKEQLLIGEILVGLAPCGAGTAARAAKVVPKYAWITRWGRDGLEAGDWVMKGGKTRLNYSLSGKWEPWFQKYPWGNIPASFESGKTYKVLNSALKNPKGGIIDGRLKALFRQKKYLP